MFRVDCVKVRRARLAKVLSREEVAVKAGVHPWTIRMMETDERRKTKPETIRAVAAALDVEAGSLLAEDG